MLFHNPSRSTPLINSQGAMLKSFERIVIINSKSILPVCNDDVLGSLVSVERSELLHDIKIVTLPPALSLHMCPCLGACPPRQRTHFCKTEWSCFIIGFCTKKEKLVLQSDLIEFLRLRTKKRRLYAVT